MQGGSEYAREKTSKFRLNTITRLARQDLDKRPYTVTIYAQKYRKSR